MKIHNIEQRSDEWHKIRLGKVTGSAVKVLYGNGKGRKTYMNKLADERLNGTSKKFSGTEAMIRGTNIEPKARSAYEVIQELQVQEIGFCEHDELAAGCSLDGIVDDGDKRGILEIKCPNSSTHMAYLHAKMIPKEYVPQITHNLWITGYDFVDFISYDDRDEIEPENTIFVRRAYRNEFNIDGHEGLVRIFLIDLEKLVQEKSLSIGSDFYNNVMMPIFGGEG